MQSALRRTIILSKSSGASPDGTAKRRLETAWDQMGHLLRGGLALLVHCIARRTKDWGKAGALGESPEDCVRAALLAIPGIRPVLVALPLIAWIVGALEGHRAIWKGRPYGRATQKDSVVHCEMALKTDKFLPTVLRRDCFLKRLGSRTSTPNTSEKHTERHRT